MKEKPEQDFNKLGFEEAIKNLTEIVDKIESGDTPLQSSLEQYEQGMALIKHCRGILQTAEKKIEKIATQDSEDNARDEDL